MLLSVMPNNQEGTPNIQMLFLSLVTKIAASVEALRR
jgi:hypothetical protein